MMVSVWTTEKDAVDAANRLAQALGPWGDRANVFTLWDVSDKFWVCPESAFDALVDYRLRQGLSVPDRIYTTD